VKSIATPKLRQISPALIGALVVIWLLLSQSLDPGSITLGFVLALAVAWASAALRPTRPRLRRPLAAVRLIATVLVEITRSNLAVARIVLGLTGGRKVTSGFVDIPLDIRDPHGVAGLAAIITSTPGTVWIGLSEDGKTLTLHVLDVRDDDSLTRLIKDRYEQPLMRIFE
jgi:multicomponent K+:H+ antiporter subunit E